MSSYDHSFSGVQRYYGEGSSVGGFQFGTAGSSSHAAASKRRQKEMFDRMIRDMKKRRMDAAQVPREKVPANASLGDHQLVTKSTSSVVLRSGKPKGTALSMLLKGMSKSIQYRWQSIRPFVSTNNEFGPTVAAVGNRSLDLSVVAIKGGADTQVSSMEMPMYAFDLTSLPTNVSTAVATKTGYATEMVPFYRLVKKTNIGVTAGQQGPAYSLANNQRNYYWVPQAGLNNGPSADYYDESNLQWSVEKANCNKGTAWCYKNDWVAVDALFKCDEKSACKVHMSIVRFKNNAGPERNYCNSQVFSHTANTTSTTMDSVLPDSGEKTSSNDVFWEAFWDSKVTHPLSSFNMPNKEPKIEWIKDDVISLRPFDHDTVDPGHVMHKKSMNIFSGDWVNLLSSAAEDIRSTGLTGHQPPVAANWDGTATGPSTWDFAYAYGFNPIQRNSDAVQAYINSETDRAKNVWLLIWMEYDRPVWPPAGGQTIQDAWYNRPERDLFETVTYTNPALTIPKFGNDCCTFDLRVRKKVTLLKQNEI